MGRPAGCRAPNCGSQLLRPGSSEIASGAQPVPNALDLTDSINLTNFHPADTHVGVTNDLPTTFNVQAGVGVLYDATHGTLYVDANGDGNFDNGDLTIHLTGNVPSDLSDMVSHLVGVSVLEG